MRRSLRNRLGADDVAVVMRAVVYDELGPPEVLHLGEVPEPHAGEGQVRVRVAATSVNPMDWKLRRGPENPQFPVEFPAIPGSDVAGTVDEVGEGVTGVQVGDVVVGSSGGHGAAAEYAVLYYFAPAPTSVDVTVAAALPMASETAYRALGLLDLSSGDTVVVDGAAGGVGSAAVQLAVARGVTVVGTASPANHDYLRELGAVPTTYGDGLADRVRALVDGPVAGALDVVGKGSVPALVELTGDPTRVVTIADFGVGDSGVQVTTGGGDHEAAYREAARLVDEGRFRVEIAATLPWTRLAEAHALSEAGHTRGKIVVTVGDGQ